jgi:hypothetical protein
MKSILYLLLFIMFLPVYSQNKWEETIITNKETPIKIECPDSMTCYILTNWGIPYSLFKTTDQGNSWFPIFTNRINSYYSEDLSVPDTNNIFIKFEKKHILKSEDGGKNFNTIDIDGMTNFSYIEMFNYNIGFINSGWGGAITHNSWDTYTKFIIDTLSEKFSISNPKFANDSILYASLRESKVTPPIYILKFNLKTNKCKLNLIDKNYFYVDDLCVVNENLLFVCGKSNNISGGSGHDAIYKSTDGGESWRRVLDLSTTVSKHFYNNPFGLQQIAFKDSLTGVAVGQFGKILYTYDGGESWFYEYNVPHSIQGVAVMKVRYAGSSPIIATDQGTVHKLAIDNIAPKPEDTLTISGRVWEGKRGQPNIPVSLGYRVTMTDAEGYYKFTKVKAGNYILKALNKYYDGVNPLYYYKPFDYTPLHYDIELTHDTSGFDFNAEDLRVFYSASGIIKNVSSAGLAGITLKVKDSTAVSDSNGIFYFRKIESRRQYDLTPISSDYSFSPAFHTINLITGDTTGLEFTATPVTSVWESGSDKGIVISPNPAGDYIVISIPEINPTVNRRVDGLVDKIRIFNTLGIDLTPDLSINGEEVRIDVSHLPAGVYFMKIDGMYLKTEKFLIIR